ncbi:MAG TPA: methyltransferase domain-containing protein [Myxococcota bacterium]|nr:methyltransferase domain-containing protein [Myxococcota bacterium]
MISQRFGFSPSAIYGPDFYTGSACGQTIVAAERIAYVIRDVVGPASVFEFGCGRGSLLGAFADLGVPAFGCEGSEHGVAMCPRSVFVFQADLRQPLRLNRTFDHVLCIEVAEHLPKRAARGLVTMLSAAAERGVIFAASGPGELGDDHINLQPSSYWESLFAEHGLVKDEPSSRALVERLAAVDAPAWYAHTTLFTRKPS